MVGTFSVVLQSPSYDGTGGNGEQIPLPVAAAQHQGQGLVEVLALFAGITLGEQLDLGKLKEGFQLNGALTQEAANNALLREGGESYASALSMRDAIVRTRTDWPEEDASGLWDDSGLPAEEQDGDTARDGGKVRLLFDVEDVDNDGTQVVFMLYGFVQQWMFRRAAPTHRDRILFTVSFVPASLTISAVA